MLTETLDPNQPISLHPAPPGAQGTLWRYVRASMTIVGLLPPVSAENGDLLVDGGCGGFCPSCRLRWHGGLLMGHCSLPIASSCQAAPLL